MADKKISEFPTLVTAQDNDLILVSSNSETYNMKVSTLKEATSKVAADAVSEAAAAKSAAQQAVTDAGEALTKANKAISDSADAKAAAEKAESDAASAEDAATRAADDADTAKAAASKAVEDADRAEAAATQAAGSADRAETASDEAVTKSNTAARNAETAVRMASSSDSTAALALQKATNAENEAAEVSNYLNRVEQMIQLINLSLESKIDYLFESNGYLFGSANGEIVAGPVGPFAGSGGGGGGSSGGNNADIQIKNTSGWMSKTVSQDEACPVSFNWSSVENEMATGNGSLNIIVSNSVKATMEVSQGDVTVDVAPYLVAGGNTVAFTISDIYGNSRTIRVTVTVVVLTLESSFDSSVPYTGAINFTYTPTGSVSKTMHFILDGREIGTATTSVSGRQQSYTIMQQSHGAHTFRCYFEAEINGQVVRSNELYYEIICLEPLNDTPIITSNFRRTEATQYTPLNVDYTVYNPASMTSDVVIKVNGAVVSTPTVDRTSQVFSYRAVDVGTLTIQISTGTQGQEDYASKSWTLEISESDIDVEAETEALALYLSSYGRTNTEEKRSEWKFQDISATLTGFNYTSDGWQRDEDGATVLRVAGDARVTIPYQIFAQDFRGTGKTIEIEFATRTVMNYDSVILSCLSNGRGLSMTAQGVSLASEQSGISAQFKDNEHVRVAFVVEKRTENRLIYCYLNGIMSGVVQYPVDDDFSQVNPVGISIGSNDCTTDIYCIRVYDNDLTRYQILDNWIADTQTIEDMVTRYTHNKVYDAYGAITIENLPGDLPYLVIRADELPQYKGDKKTVSGYYVDPVNPTRSFTFTGAQWDVQGTSSQYYARKNYKGKFKNGFVLANGSTVKTYQLLEGDLPVSVFCFKADVASSEGANNVELARLYNSACPYKTPAQVADSRVKQGIDGFPIVIFWDNGDKVEFIGKYNFNIDKGAEDYFGFVDGDESWEIKNNTGNRVLWKSADYTGNGWLNDFEARFPDTDPPYTDPTQLKELAEWLVKTDTTNATNRDLPSPVTYTVKVTEMIEKVDPETGAISYEEVISTKDVTFTTDSAEYRLAKFRDELPDYVELDSALFYYLFTESFLMVDSRAKNMFPSFIGDAIGGDGA